MLCYGNSIYGCCLYTPACCFGTIPEFSPKTEVYTNVCCDENHMQPQPASFFAPSFRSWLPHLAWRNPPVTQPKALLTQQQSFCSTLHALVYPTQRVHLAMYPVSALCLACQCFTHLVVARHFFFFEPLHVFTETA